MLNPNCSELVFRLKISKDIELGFSPKFERDMTKLMEELEPYEYNKESTNEFVLEDEEGDILFRKRCDGSEEETFEGIKPILKKWKIKMIEIGDKPDVPLFSIGDMFFYKLEGVVKAVHLGYSNIPYANKVHKKLLNEWRLKR